MSKMFNKLPSEIVNIYDEYTAFCFNEACFYIRAQVEMGEEPNFNTKEVKQHYTSFTEFYKQFT